MENADDRKTAEETLRKYATWLSRSGGKWNIPGQPFPPRAVAAAIRSVIGTRRKPCRA